MATAEWDVTVVVAFFDKDGNPLPAGRYICLTAWEKACPNGPTAMQMRGLIRRRRQNGLEITGAVAKLGGRWVIDVVAFGIWFRRQGKQG